MWIKSEVLTLEGEGTYSRPYCLNEGYCPGSQSVVSINAPTNGSALAAGTVITMTGTANGADNYDGDNYGGTGLTRSGTTVVTADVCTTNGQCINKNSVVALGKRNDAENWSLSWNADELPAGTYAGTVVVRNTQGGAAESTYVSFTIAQKALAIKTIKDTAFNIKLGDANVVNLAGCALPYSDQGITIANTGGVLYASGTGLNANTEISCGGTKISASVVTPVLPSVSAVSLF
ncbi:hypothetical protein FWH30_01600 [Microgenomates group bacterium]|nr:hypothetical protein [Microgenomates group bacterium]